MSTKLKRSDLDNIYTGYSSKVDEGLTQVDKDYLRWCQVVDSKHPIEAYLTSKVNSGMKEWIGERIISKFSTSMVKIINKPFQNSVKVSRRDLFYGMNNKYDAQFVELGIDQQNLWPELGGDVLADNPLYGDGKLFYCVDRQINDDDPSILLDNLVAGGFTLANFLAARLKGDLVKNSIGKVVKLKFDLLVVGPKHKRFATQLMNNESIMENGEKVDNDLRGSFELQVNPAFTGAKEDDFRLLCTNRALKPVIVQKALEGKLTAVDDEKDSYVFLNDENLYGLQSIGNAGPGVPHLAIAGIKP